MSTEIENAPQPAVPEVPAQAPEVAPAAPTEPLSRRDSIRQEFAKTNRGQHAQHQPREQGKFAGPPALPPPLSPAPVAPAVQRPAMPKAYKLELQKHWEAIPPEFATAVHQRELDAERGIQPLKARAQEADAIFNELKPYDAMIRAEGGTPQTAIRDLLQTAALFRTGQPLEKAQAVLGIMQRYGISPQHLQQVLSGQAVQPAQDPRYTQLAQTVEQLTQRFTKDDERVEQQRITAIQKFADDPANAHFAAVQERMLALLQNPQALGIDVSAMNDQEKLKAAYDAAIRLDPALYLAVQAAQTATQQTKTHVQQAKAAAVQLKPGAPASGPAPAVNPKDRRALIKATLAAAR